MCDAINLASQLLRERNIAAFQFATIVFKKNPPNR